MKSKKTSGLPLFRRGNEGEAPFAYKDINEVMQSQTMLVDVLGKFYPTIVQMDGSNLRKFGKRRKEVAGE